MSTGDAHDNLEVLQFNIRAMVSEPGKSPLEESCIDALLAILREFEEIKSPRLTKLGTTIAEIRPCYVQGATVIHRGGCGECTVESSRRKP